MNRFATFILLVSFTGSVFAQEPASLAISAPTQDQETGDDSASKKADDEKTPSNPVSVPGIIKSVSDDEKNTYPIVVVQPMSLTEQMESSYSEKFTPIEKADAATDAATDDETAEEDEKTKYERKGTMVESKTVAAASQSPVLIPLQPSMPCFKVSGGVVTQASATDLTPDTHVLVAGSVHDAMFVAKVLLKHTNNQVILTGTKPRLPHYILAVNTTPKVEQTKSLAELLQESSPYRGKAEFFGSLTLRDSTYKKAKKSSEQHPLPLFLYR